MGIIIDIDEKFTNIREPSSSIQDADFVVIEITTDSKNKQEINLHQIGSEAGLATINSPGISNGELKSLVYSGKAPKRFSNLVITKDIVKSLKDSIAAGLSFLASALDGNIKNVTVSLIKLEA